MFQSCAAVRLQAVAVRCHSVSAQLVPLLLEPCHPISLWLWPELDDLSDLLDISGCFVNWLLLFNGQQCSWDHRWSVATTIAEDQETLSSVCCSSVAEFYVIKPMILFSSGFVWFSKTVFQSISHQTKGLNTLPSGAKATFLGLTVPIWPPSPTLNIINKIPQNECRSKTRLRFKVWNI